MHGSPKNSWQPEITGDTTTRAYWLNWRVALCAIWISVCMFVAALVIWKYEGTRNSKPEENEPDSVGTLYEDEAWRPCLKEIHPACLLAYRVVAFLLLLALLIVNVIVDSGSIFYFYTQWTFTLVTIYFGLGTLLSIYGCHQHRNETSGSKTGTDAERGMYNARRREEKGNASNTEKVSGQEEQFRSRKTAGIWTYVFQIIFQMNAGAVMLTDFVFWFIIVPFLTLKDYNLNLLLVGMHSVNAVFLFGDTALNSLRFPWFRAAYFVLWTSVFVIFQWVVHACVSIWWPYPFLDLSSSYAPLWYFLVGFMHIPCYAIFALVVKMKHYLWSRWFPLSYQCRS